MDGSLSNHMDDDQLAILPTDPVPNVDPLPVEYRDTVFDLVTMERKLEEYQSKAHDLQSLHMAWHQAYQTWGNRLDEVYGKVDSIDETVAVMLGQEPGTDYEAFQILSLPAVAQGLAAVLGAGQSGYVLHKVRQSYKAAKAAKDTVAAKGLRWSKVSVVIAGVGFIFSGYVAYRTVADRTNFLIGALPDLEEWFDQGASQIATMKSVTENSFIDSIRDIAKILGVDDADNNVMYHNVINTLNAAMTDAAEVEAQYNVATRMLCPIPGRTPVTYSVSETATATGLPPTTVQTRADEIAADEENICAPYRPST